MYSLWSREVCVASQHAQSHLVMAQRQGLWPMGRITSGLRLWQSVVSFKLPVSSLLHFRFCCFQEYSKHLETIHLNALRLIIL